MSTHQSNKVMRDLNNVLIAEDNKDISFRMRDALENLGSFTVWTTTRADEVMDLLATSAAAFVILDIELEDRCSLDLIDSIRIVYGNNVYILVLSANWQAFDEKHVISKGADFMLRKPYQPEALILQLKNIQKMLKRVNPNQNSVEGLKIGGVEIDLKYRRMRIKDNGSGKVTEQTLQNTHMKVLKVLSANWDSGAQRWAPISREELVLKIWGPEAMNSPDHGGARLRRVIHDLRKGIDVDPVLSNRVGPHGSEYSFSAEVIPIISQE